MYTLILQSKPYSGGVCSRFTWRLDGIALYRLSQFDDIHCLDLCIIQRCFLHPRPTTLTAPIPHPTNTTLLSHPAISSSGPGPWIVSYSILFYWLIQHRVSLTYEHQFSKSHFLINFVYLYTYMYMNVSPPWETILYQCVKSVICYMRMSPL